MNITTIGLDLAKSVCHVVCCNPSGKVLRKRMLRRSQMLAFFAQLPKCLVGLEACATAHYWAREIEKLGHEVRQIAPMHVKPFLRGNKNDYNDALAIAEAVTRPEMRFVRTKSQEQLDIKALHVLRKKCERDRTANCNEIRGLLAEHGIVLPEGVNNVYKRIPELFDRQTSNGLSGTFKELLERHYQKLVELNEHLEFYTKKVNALSRIDECERLQSVPGIGPVTSSALFEYIGDGSEFKNGRAVSASLGLVPRQYSSGGKQNLLGISKRGNSYLRSLLVQGANAALRVNLGKNTSLSKWLDRLVLTRGRKKAIVALANKLARICWAILKNGGCYDESHLVAA